MTKQWWNFTGSASCEHLLHLSSDPEGAKDWASDNLIGDIAVLLTTNQLAVLVLTWGITSEELENYSITRKDWGA